jgi:hypothetical protein
MHESQNNYFSSLLKTTESPTKAEQTRLMSENEPDPRAMEPKMDPARVHLTIVLISMFMFVLGTLMVVSTLNYKQSDKSCAAQLSIWCRLESLTLHALCSDIPASSTASSSSRIRRTRLGEYFHEEAFRLDRCADSRAGREMASPSEWYAFLPFPLSNATLTASSSDGHHT